MQGINPKNLAGMAMLRFETLNELLSKMRLRCAVKHESRDLWINGKVLHIR